MDWAHFSEYGLVGTMMGVLFFILWRIIVWTMSFIDKTISQQTEERKVWQAIIADIRSSIQLHNQQSIDAHAGLKEASNFQRQEHEKMISRLDEIGVNQKEITITLGRINGYKQ
jgi:hypothetical protein